MESACVVSVGNELCISITDVCLLLVMITKFTVVLYLSKVALIISQSTVYILLLLSCFTCLFYSSVSLSKIKI